MQSAIRSPRIIVLAFGTLIAGLVAGASFAPSRPANIASVDLEKVFNNCNLHANFEANLTKLGERFDGEIGTLKKSMEEISNELESFTKNSSAFLQKQQEVYAMIGEYKARDQFARLKIEAERAKSMRDTYEAIKVAAKSYAASHNLDFVLLNDSIPEMDRGDSQKTLQQISARRFLYANDEFDISDALIAELNATYKLDPGAKLPPAAAPGDSATGNNPNGAGTPATPGSAAAAGSSKP